MQEDRDRVRNWIQDRYGKSSPPGLAGAEPSLRGGAQADPGGAIGGAARGRRYSLEERTALLEAFHESGLSVAQFCDRQRLGRDTLYRWLRGGGKRTKRVSRRSDGRKPNASYNADQKRTALEAYARSGRTLADFAVLWGVSAHSLRRWQRLYDEHGPKGLERKPRSKATRADDRRVLPVAVRDEIARTKRRFPEFGMRKVRDFLRRFQGMRVSEGSVRKVIREEGLESSPTTRKKPRKKSKPVRRFERAKPGQLWQSDITSFVLRRHHRRVYLVVFLDDHSRYVVSWALATHQKAPLVHETLLDGIARFGKPEEVLTDQGPQYFAWRGKAAFQKLLAREGVGHVVARTHHPQTVGKCERLWKTVGEEFWDRAVPQDLSEARERLGHWFAFYNHFRPHQGIGGLVPADRFFGAEDALRKTLEAQLSANELALAVSDTPRKSVFFFGQVGDDQVSVHGERGKLVIQTPDGNRREMEMDELGAPPAGEPVLPKKPDHDAADDADDQPFGAGVLP